MTVSATKRALANHWLFAKGSGSDMKNDFVLFLCISLISVSAISAWPNHDCELPVAQEKKVEMTLLEMLRLLRLPEKEEEISVEDKDFANLIAIDRAWFKVDVYLRVASNLQQMGKEKACKTLLCTF
jgi:hypothetical protein